MIEKSKSLPPQKKRIVITPINSPCFLLLWPANSLNAGLVNREVTENSACHMQKATDCPEAMIGPPIPASVWSVVDVEKMFRVKRQVNMIDILVCKYTS